MFMRIADAALANRVVVILLVIGLVVVGGASLQKLPIDAQPDISPRQVLVVTQAPGLGPLDIERFITAPLELALQGIPHMENLRSVSRYGLSVIYVRFADDVDIYAARNLVSSRLPQVPLPAEASAPQMGPISTGLGEIFQFEVRGAHRSPMDLRTILDWQIAPRLRQVPGVIDVNANGGELKSYEIQVSANALTRYGLAIRDVFDAAQRNNGARGGATLEHNGEQAVIRGEGLVQTPADLGNIVLRTSEAGVPLYLRQVATIVAAPRPRLGAVTRNGKGETVAGVVLMLMGENTRTVAQDVAKAVDDIRSSLPPGVEIVPYYNRADLIGLTIRTVAHNLAEGAVLVVVVLFALLGNARAGLIVASAIPLSMLAAATAMYFVGLSGNLMSLGAIDFGLIVDGSVVMIENVVRRRAESPSRSVDETVHAAAREVARPIVFAVMIIVVVYLPILSLQGVEGKLFRPMALTVIFALIASLVLTLALMPVLATYLLRGRIVNKDSRVVIWVRAVYAPMLLSSTRHPGWTLGLAVLLLLGSGSLASRLGAEFIPRLDEGALTVTTTKLPSIGLSSAVKTQTMIERTLLKFPEVTTAVTLGGSSEIPTDPMGVEQSDTFIMLKPRSEWRTAHDREGLIGAFSAALTDSVPGLQLSWAQPIEMRMDDMLQGVRSDVAAVIYGDDADALHSAAQSVAAALSGVPGAADVHAQQTAGQPYLRIIADRAAVARYGMNVSQVLDEAEALGGRAVGTMVEGNARFDIRVRVSPEDRSDVAHISSLRISDGTGRSVPLSQVADIRMEEGPAQIDREQRRRKITVQANVRGRDVASFVADAKNAVAAQVRLPTGYSIEWGGQFKNLQQAVSRLVVVVPVALAPIFALLFIMFRRFSLSVMIFCNVPFAAVGGILALTARGLPFSISAAVGFIALFGIAVLNGVVLVTTIEEKREEGLGPMGAAFEAAMSRLRPVLMTATVASLGFLPMAVSTSAGAEVQRPLATVVIGGLVTATLLTLLVLPAIYPWFRRSPGVAQHPGSIALRPAD